MSPAHIKGPIQQRELLPLLKELVDAAMAPNSTAHKDIARNRLRTLCETAHWRTGWIGRNIGARRSRFLNSIGLWTPTSWVMGGWKGEPPEPAEDEE